MGYKSEAVRLVEELVERANNQANTIDELKLSNVKLLQQLKDEYSTDTDVLVEREVLQDLKMDFDELADGFRQLTDTFDNIESYANDIASEADYHDARSFRDTAIECISKIEDILDPDLEEESTDKETV
jgi:hypothetical protein